MQHGKAFENAWASQQAIKNSKLTSHYGEGQHNQDDEDGHTPDIPLSWE